MAGGIVTYRIMLSKADSLELDESYHFHKASKLIVCDINYKKVCTKQIHASNGKVHGSYLATYAIENECFST